MASTIQVRVDDELKAKTLEFKNQLKQTSNKTKSK